MATLRAAKITLKNAQALELFMRVSPEAASFLECFSFLQASGNARVVFIYDKLLPEENDIEDARQCNAHLQMLFQEAENISGKRIVSRPQKRGPIDMKIPDAASSGITAAETPERHPAENEHITMQAAIDLSNRRLSDIILDLAARLINQRRSVDKNFTLSHFPTRENAPENYDGITDSGPLHDKLSQGFPGEVTRKDLEPLLPQMTCLTTKFRQAKLPERYR